jgi:amino acid adenylation domain-containing protein
MSDDVSGDVAGLSLAQRTELELRLLRSRAATLNHRVIPRRDPGASIPLSFAQQRLWFLDQLHPGRSTYNLARKIRMRGVLDVDALRRSIDAVVARHETLRTTMVAVEGIPQQIIASSLQIPLSVIDLDAQPDRQTQAQRLAAEEVRRPFDLARGPLLRATLVRVEPEEHLLILTVHHIISDAWSLGIMFREIGALYQAYTRDEPSPLSDLPLQYADFAVWQHRTLQGKMLERELGYWREQLKGVPPALELLTDRPRPPVQSTRGAKQSTVIPRRVSDGLKELSRREGVTPFTTLLAAFHTLLGRYTGQQDIVVGSPVAGRTQVETEGLVGFFVNTLALRLDLSGNPTFLELIHRAHEVALGAFAHQNLPFEKLVEELQPERDLRHTPVFQVALAYQNFPSHKLELPGLTLQSETTETGNAKFDLMLYTWQRPDGLRAVLEYNIDLFDAGTIIRMLSHFETLLESIALNPNQRLSELRLLSQEEEHTLLGEWNATASDFPQDRPIHRFFEEQAARTPQAVAVEVGDQRVTYSELDRRANQLAHYLRAHGVGPEVRVGVCLDRSPHLIVALLGILKAGGAYVPLDPAYPQDRIQLLVKDAQIAVLVTDDHLRTALAGPKSAAIVRLDQELASIAGESNQQVGSEVNPANLAYVIYTSGSTGTPKGVGITHRNAAAFLSWAKQITPALAGARVLATTSISFDLSVYEIFGTLSWGGTIVLVGTALELPDRPELRVLGAATLLNTVPSAAAALVRLGAIPRGLMQMNLAGEAVTRTLVEELYAAGADKVVNLYGPTETTTYSTVAHLASGELGVPGIGRPIANTSAYVLDRELRPSPIGVPGELYLGGGGVARGYLGRAAFTAERFVPDPFGPLIGSSSGERLYRTGDRVRWHPDGTLEFLGRLDQQLKLRGFRIEPGEIETILEQHPSVGTAVVMAREFMPGDIRLVAYVVSDGVSGVDAAQLRGFLEERVPEYMVPSAIMVLDSLPLMPNGKLDRAALPVPESAYAEDRQGYVAPRTPVEEMLAAIWATVLRLERVGIRDNFFALGGHSLLATQVVSRIRTVIGVELPLSAVFEGPTVAQLAVRIGSELLTGSPPQGPVLARVSREPYRSEQSGILHRTENT